MVTKQLERAERDNAHPLADILVAAGFTREKRASDQIYDLLRQAIVSLKLAPNQPISEQDVANALNLSRTPVREAFKRLSEEGLLVSYPQLATVVAPIRMESLLEAQFLRENIESAMAERAAAAADDQGVARLHDVLERHRAAALAERWAEFHALDEETHRVINEIAGMPGLNRLIEQARAHLDRVRHVVLPERDTAQRVIRQHAAVIDAISAGRPKDAREAMIVHTRDILKRLPDLHEGHPELFEERPVSRAPWRAR